MLIRKGVQGPAFSFSCIYVFGSSMCEEEREIGFARVNRKKEKAKQITWDDIKI